MKIVSTSITKNEWISLFNDILLIYLFQSYIGYISVANKLTKILAHFPVGYWYQFWCWTREEVLCKQRKETPVRLSKSTNANCWVQRHPMSCNANCDIKYLGYWYMYVSTGIEVLSGHSLSGPKWVYLWHVNWVDPKGCFTSHLPYQVIAIQRHFIWDVVAPMSVYSRYSISDVIFYMLYADSDFSVMLLDL